MNKKMILSIAAFFAISAIAVTPVSAEDTEEVPVTYDNRTTITSENGVWGVVIPTAVQFTDDKVTGHDFSVELTGVNGYTLDDLGEDLVVTISTKSLNGYKLVDTNSNAGEYEVVFSSLAKVDNPVIAEQPELTLNSGTTSVEVAKLTPSQAKRIGEAKLTLKPLVKGIYTDTVTFGISSIGSNLK